jgi:hypothetical protein
MLQGILADEDQDTLAGGATGQKNLNERLSCGLNGLMSALGGFLIV